MGNEMTVWPEFQAQCSLSTDTIMAFYYDSGYSLKQVGAIVGLSHKTVKRRLLAQGVTIRPGNNVARSNWLMERKKEAV